MLLTLTAIQTIATVSLVTYQFLSKQKPTFKCYKSNGFKHYKYY